MNYLDGSSLTDSELEFNTAIFDSPTGNADIETVLSHLGLVLPREGVMLDIGAADMALFQRQARFRERGLYIVGLDPNLLFESYRQFEYLRDNPDREGTIPEEEVVSVAGIGQYLPFKGEAFDLVVSHAAASTYLSFNPEKFALETFTRLYSEVYRVMKYGALAHLGPMDDKRREISEEVLSLLGFKYEMIEPEKASFVKTDISWSTVILQK